MKTHTSSFKKQIKLMGKEIDSRITFGSTVLGKDDLNAVTPSYQGAILKSVMKQLDIDSNVEIPIGTILKYEFGLKVNGEYEYINYGNYVVYSIEKQEDTNSYKIVCYDKLLYSMLDYVKLPITYPISIRDYINAISTVLGLKFANKSGTFANYDKQIQADLYDGLGYTFRDILDELAQVTASTICLNNNDELEIRYITETGDTIDEEFLKDVNVNFGEKFGAVNTIVLSRSGDSDSVYYPPVLPANPYEIKISDNQIMNGNDRADFLPDIYNKLNGLEFYTNDFVSTGICYYDLCDRYSVKVGDNTYSCVMFNDEVLVTQGLEENIYTELPEQTETDYKHASKDDRMINQVYLIVKKNEAEILAVINTTEQLQKEINPIKDESGSEIIIEDASDNPLINLEIEGKSTQKTSDGKNLYNVNDVYSRSSYVTTDKEDWITITRDNSSGTSTLYISNYLKPSNLLKVNTTYYLVVEIKSVTGNGRINFVHSNSSTNKGQFNAIATYNLEELTPNSILKISAKTRNSFDDCITMLRQYLVLEVGQSASITYRMSIFENEEDANNFIYEPFGITPRPDYPRKIESVGYENLFDKDNANILEAHIQTSTGTLVENPDNNKVLYIPCKPNTTYTISKIKNIRFRVATYESEITTPNSQTLQDIISVDGSAKVTITTSSNAYYLYVGYYSASNDTLTEQEILDSIQIEKGSIAHSYIPYGKYGVEVKTVGKNLFDKDNGFINAYLTATGTQMNAGTNCIFDYIKVKPSKDYIFSSNKSLTNIAVYYYDKFWAFISRSVVQNKNSSKFTIPDNCKYIRLGFNYDNVTTITQELINTLDFQLEENTEVTKFQLHQKNTLLILLNAPLRSLPNGVKDIAYIKNNKLYVDRYVGSVVLNGSENWKISSTGTPNYFYSTTISPLHLAGTEALTSHYEYKQIYSSNTNQGFYISTATTSTIRIRYGEEQTVDEFKTWLSQNNVQVDYELATPITEELDEIEMLKTLKGYNNISTTDELLPIINLTYVRDTIIADYVENHVTELKLTEKEIKSSVESVSSSVDGLNTTINRVEEITNDNSQVINVISTNIDRTSGEVREVTTTTGFTFNADGMTIDDGSGFKAQHRSNGTYYKDGDSIVGQYTKDGSKQKDLELFGTYSYGKETIDDTPMFIGQLYTNENGEQAFGHFYNGEG